MVDGAVPHLDPRVGPCQTCHIFFGAGNGPGRVRSLTRYRGSEWVLPTAKMSVLFFLLVRCEVLPRNGKWVALCSALFIICTEAAIRNLHGMYVCMYVCMQVCELCTVVPRELVLSRAARHAYKPGSTRTLGPSKRTG
jgi:hypothetical protein